MGQIKRYHGDHAKAPEGYEMYEIEKEKLSKESQDQLQIIDDFKEGRDFETKGNIMNALERFKRVKEILVSSKHENSQNFVYIQKKIAFLS